MKGVNLLYWCGGKIVNVGKLYHEYPIVPGIGEVVNLKETPGGDRHRFRVMSREYTPLNDPGAILVDIKVIRVEDDDE